jgi:DNA (cytosine-5)-methyltransferase 1
MFDLSTIDTDGIRIHLQRPRLFETNWGLTAPRPATTPRTSGWPAPTGALAATSTRPSTSARAATCRREKDVVKALLGVEHDMTWNGLFECIPPAYSEHVGTQLLAHIESEVAA